VAQVYSFVDDNGVTRLFAEIHPDPAGTPFNGGTITESLLIATTGTANPLKLQVDPEESTVNLLDCSLVEESSWEARIRAVDHGSSNVDVALSLFANGTGTSTIEAYDDTGTGKFVFTTDAGLTVNAKAATVGNILLIKVGNSALFAISDTGAVGFFGAAAAAQQTLHSATATPEQIALALEASTLMGGD
jgi:hypothetical protein